MDDQKRQLENLKVAVEVCIERLEDLRRKYERLIMEIDKRLKKG